MFNKQKLFMLIHIKIILCKVACFLSTSQQVVNITEKKEKNHNIVCLTPAIANKLHFSEVKQIKHI